MGRKSKYVGVAGNKKGRKKQTSLASAESEGSHSYLATPSKFSEDKVCSGCREPLRKIKWSGNIIILTCDNINCSKYRQPQGREGKESLSDASKRYYL